MKLAGFAVFVTVLESSMYVGGSSTSRSPTRLPTTVNCPVKNPGIGLGSVSSYVPADRLSNNTYPFESVSNVRVAYGSLDSFGPIRVNVTPSNGWLSSLDFLYILNAAVPGSVNESSTVALALFCALSTPTKD